MDLRLLLPSIMTLAKAELSGKGVTPKGIVYTRDDIKIFPLDFTSVDTTYNTTAVAKAYCATNNGIIFVLVYESYFLERSSYIADSIDLIGTGIYTPEHIHVLGSTPTETLLLEQFFYRSEDGISFIDDVKRFPMANSPLLDNIWTFKEA